jgi:MFS family permease
MLVCMLLGTAGSVGMWAVVVVLPVVQKEFVVDRAAASLPYTTTMVGFALGNVLVGRMVDRHGIVLPVIAGALSLGVGFIAAALTASVWQFAVLQGLFIGIGTASTFGPLIADLSHWFEKRRGMAVAVAASGNYLAGAIWPNVIDVYLQSEGWRMTYMGIGLFCMLFMIPLALLLRRRPPVAGALGQQGPASDAFRSMRVGTIALSPFALQMLLSLAGVACCVAMSMPQVHLVAYCADLGFGVTHGAQMLSLMLFGGVFSRIASGIIADYIGGIRTLLLGTILQCLALILYLPYDGLMSLYVVSLLFGLSQGGIVPAYAIIVREYLPAHEAGQRVGIVIMSTILGMALGGWMSGWVYDLTGSYAAAFLNGIAWNVLNIAIMLFVLTRTRRPVPAVTF